MTRYSIKIWCPERPYNPFRVVTVYDAITQETSKLVVPVTHCFFWAGIFLHFCSFFTHFSPMILLYTDKNFDTPHYIWLLLQVSVISKFGFKLQNLERSISIYGVRHQELVLSWRCRDSPWANGLTPLIPRLQETVSRLQTGELRLLPVNSDWLVKVSDSTERLRGKGVGTPFSVRRESDPITRCFGLIGKGVRLHRKAMWKRCRDTLSRSQGVRPPYKVVKLEC